MSGTIVTGYMTHSWVGDSYRKVGDSTTIIIYFTHVQHCLIWKSIYILNF